MFNDADYAALSHSGTDPYQVSRSSLEVSSGPTDLLPSQRVFPIDGSLPHLQKLDSEQSLEAFYRVTDFRKISTCFKLIVSDRCRE